MIAPFEGLYRRSGYAALDATRAALTDAEMTEAGVIPLALDDLADSARARRSAEKLMVDPAVGAVIGPLSPAMTASTRDVLRAAPIWIAPYAVDPAGSFADPTTATAWADELVAAIAEAAHAQGQSRLVLTGWTPGWPEHDAEEWRAIVRMPVLLLDKEADGLNAIQPDDAILWLGDPGEGARFLVDMRGAYPDIPFWLGPQGADPVFAARADGRLDNAYWAIWSAVNYNDRHYAPNFPDEPAAQLVYLATRDVLDRMADGAAPRAPADDAPQWQVQLLSFAPDGSSIPYPIE